MKTLLSKVLGAMAALAIAVSLGCTSDPVKPMSKAQFVGSERCGGCHVDEYRTWKDTYHNKMVRPVRDGLLKDALDNWAKDAKGNAGPTKANVTGAPAQLGDVVYVIGSKWKQRYLVKNPNTGNHQFLDKQWNRVSNAWEGYGQKNDWETQCSTCHATGFRITAYDAKNPAATKVSMSRAQHRLRSLPRTGIDTCPIPQEGRHLQSEERVQGRGRQGLRLLPHPRREHAMLDRAGQSLANTCRTRCWARSYKAGQDDWTKWYPDKMLIPGIQPDDPLSARTTRTPTSTTRSSSTTQAQKCGYFEARKHHEEYQEYLQSKHAKAGAPRLPGLPLVARGQGQDHRGRATPARAATARRWTTRR